MKILEVKTEKRRIGDLGEKAAAQYLRRRGYMILEKNYVGKSGSEIDIIARRPFSSTYAFIEVKTRTEGGEFESRPAAAVTPEKQRRIIAASRSYLPEGSKNATYRFDVIEVYLGREGDGYKIKKIEHLPDTFNYDTAYRSGGWYHN